MLTQSAVGTGSREGGVGVGVGYGAGRGKGSTNTTKGGTIPQIYTYIHIQEGVPRHIR